MEEFETWGESTNQESLDIHQRPRQNILKHHLRTIATICFLEFCTACCAIQPAQFYPPKAEEKGVSPTIYGFVFGIYNLVSLVWAPIIGKYIYHFGVENTFHLGLVVTASSTICFGLLNYVNSYTAFVALSFILRITEAIGTCAFLVACYSAAIAICPKHVGTIFAIEGTAYGLGTIVGPLLGSLLFMFGGYTLLFVVLGLLLLLCNFISLLILPSFLAGDGPPTKVSLWQLLRIPGIFLNACGIVATSISSGFTFGTLELNIRVFKLTPMKNGLIFTIEGITYFILAPLIGRLADKCRKLKWILFTGTIFTIVSWIIYGPVPYSGIPKTLPLLITALAIQGIGIALVTVPSMNDSIQSAVEAGYSCGLPFYCVLSGIWAGSFALGYFIGPSAGGYLYETVGLPHGSLFVIIVFILLAILNLTVQFRDKRGVKKGAMKYNKESDSIFSAEEKFHRTF